MQIKITKKLIQSIYQPRQNDSHKGNHGHALMIAGSAGKMGAAVIAARACLRSGVGLLTLKIPTSQAAVLHAAIPEAMLNLEDNFSIDYNAYSAIGIGPGMDTHVSSLALVSNVLKQNTKPIVMDADALNLLAENKKLWKLLRPGTIMTPHPKEFDRLFGAHEDEHHRLQTATQIAKELQIIIVLKGHQTHIVDETTIYQNTNGNAGLAKGGSGDALTGIITAFLAQSYTPINAAILGVYLHGLAADITLKTQSKESMLITDVIENMGSAFATLGSK